jgi:hypothetical protein
VHNWTILVLAVGLFAWGAFSRRLEHGVVTPPMFFVTFGLLLGPEGTGWITLDVGGEDLPGVAEPTLTLVLFTDGSRLNLRALRHDYPLPARLLGVGLPLTLGLGDWRPRRSARTARPRSPLRPGTFCFDAGLRFSLGVNPRPIRSNTVRGASHLKYSTEIH